MSDLYLVLRSRLSAVAEWVELGSDLMVDARKGAGLSREAVARQLHVSTKTVERHEADGRIPRDLLAKYAELVDLEIEEPERVRVKLDGQGREAVLPSDLQTELAEAVEALAEVAPRLASVADRLEVLLAAQPQAQAFHKPGQSD